MKTFKVWAPKAEKIEIKINDAILPMTKKEQWWEYNSDIHQQVDYGFIIDGKGPYPDPRSNFQPNGVHALSRTVDHNEFQWTDKNWQSPPLSSAILYELHIGTFTPEGTFEAAIKKIDYLKDLGITHIEIMPVNEFTGERGWGYDGVNIFAPHHSYGGPVNFKKLIDHCHAAQISVILDVVYNHFGLEGNYISMFGPYFSKRYNTIWGNAFNFDDKYSAEPRQFIVDNALMWFKDFHVDGLRLDAVHAIYDQSALHILEQIAAEVKKLQTEIGRHLYLIAEYDLDSPRIIQNLDIGGYGFDAQWNDGFHHSLHSLLTGETNGYYADFGRIANLAKCLNKVFVYDGKYSEYRKAIHGRPAKNCAGYNFIAYIQNHDQVGNRATGDRISHLVSPEKTKIAAAIVLTSPFIPMLFAGEEFAASTPFQYFTDVSDSQLAKGITQGRKNEFAPFGWDPARIPEPQSPQTFESSKLDWHEIRNEPHKAMLDWYKQLIQIRKFYPDLRNGRLDDIRIDFDESQKWIRIERGVITIIVNLANDTVQFDTNAAAEIILGSDKRIEFTGYRINMPASSIVILSGSKP